MVRRTLLVVVTGLCALSTAPVSAQEEASDQLDAEARATFQAGQLAFENGRFEAALQRFREAYELSGRPILLYNIGSAADRLRRDQEALEAFERYLTEVPDSENRMQVQARIEVLRRAVQNMPSEPTDEPTDAPSPDSPNQTPTPTNDVEPPGGRRWTWVALGVGAAALAGSGLAWVLANDEKSGLVDVCAAMPGGGCTEAGVEEGWDERGIDGRITLTNVLLGVGIAGVVAGGVLFFVEGGSSGEAEAQVGIGPGSVSVRGVF